MPKAFVPKSKMSKSARKAQNKLQRVDWGLTRPDTRRIESRKRYTRTKSFDRFDEYGRDFYIA